MVALLDTTITTVSKGNLNTLRKCFPVLNQVAYLNTGTDGPIPAAASEAMAARLELELSRGRWGQRYFAETEEIWERLRDQIGDLIGAIKDSVALTRSTTDGLNAVLHGIELQAGDQVITSDEEHAGLLAPLGALARYRGVEVVQSPLAEIASAVTPKTKLVALSHVSWVTGNAAPVDELKHLGVPILYDGAQAAGAIPVSVGELNCDFYAAPGQKWLCGPDGTGFLFVRESWHDRLNLAWPHYGTLSDTQRPLDLTPAAGARRFDSGFFPGPLAVGLLKSLELLAQTGWLAVHQTAKSHCTIAKIALSESCELVTESETTLASWRDPDTAATVERLAAQGVSVRDIPGRGLIRASIGAWNSTEDIERLVEALG